MAATDAAAVPQDLRREVKLARRRSGAATTRDDGEGDMSGSETGLKRSWADRWWVAAERVAAGVYVVAVASAVVAWAIVLWHLIAWAVTSIEILAMIGDVLAEGVALAEIGKLVGLLIQSTLHALGLAAAVIAGALLARWNLSDYRAERAQRVRLALAKRRAEARAAAAEPDGGFDAAYDDMVDALERAHELMARGEVKQARHEIERALEEAA